MKSVRTSVLKVKSDFLIILIDAKQIFVKIKAKLHSILLFI